MKSKQKNIKNRIRNVVLAILFAQTQLPLSGEAQTNENEDLKLEIIKLKNKIKELESIECKTQSKSKKPGAPWHSLKVGMSKAEVKSTLGKPGKIDKWKTGEAWYYPDPRGGEVDFDVNGNATGWLEP